MMFNLKFILKDTHEQLDCVTESMQTQQHNIHKTEHNKTLVLQTFVFFLMALLMLSNWSKSTNVTSILFLDI